MKLWFLKKILWVLMELKFGITKKYKLNFIFWKLKWKIVLCKKKENALMHFLIYRKMIRRNIALIFMWKWKKKNGRMWIVNVNCVWVLSGDVDGRKMRVGIFRGKKGKRKMERRYGKNWMEVKGKLMGMVIVKINGWNEKSGLGWSLHKWIEFIFYLRSKNRNNKKI